MLIVLLLHFRANCSLTGEMFMFLTRLGEGSKAVITGDVTQIDLVKKGASGLLPARKRLENIRGIGFIELTKKDVVRHRLVQDILKAYEKKSPSKRKRKGSP